MCQPREVDRFRVSCYCYELDFGALSQFGHKLHLEREKHKEKAERTYESNATA